MPEENIGTLQGRIRFRDETASSTASFRNSLANLKRQTLSTALGFVGAGSINAAITTVTGTISNAVKSYANFEKRMLEVSTLVDTSVVKMKPLEQGVSRLSKKYGVDAGGLAAALYQTISANVDAADSLGVLETAVKAGIAGVTTTENAVDALTAQMNAFGLSSDNINEIWSSLQETIRMGRTKLEFLTPVIGQVAPLAKTAGLSFRDMNMALATITQTGMDTAAAGTALRGMLNAVIKPAEQATKAAKALGVEFDTNAIRTRGFVGWLEHVQEKTQGSEKALAQLFPEIRGMNGILQLTSNTGLKHFTDGLVSMTENVNAGNEAFAKMRESHEQTWGKIKAWWNDFWRGVGGKILDVTGQVIEDFDRLSEFEKMYRRFQEDENRTLEEGIKYRQLIVDEIERIENATDELRILGNEWYEKRIHQLETEFDKNEEIIGQIDKKKKRLEEMAEEEKRRQAKIEAAREKERKRIEAAIEKIKKQKEEEKKRAEEEKRQLQESIEILQLKAEVEESIHNTRVRNSEREIELIEEEAGKRFMTEEEKLRLIINTSEKRKNLATLEYEHAIRMLDNMHIARLKEAGENKRLVEEIRKTYIAKSKEIKAEWQEKVSKELEISAKANIEMDKSTWAKFNDEITNNFIKWKDDLKAGSSAAWSGLIGDSNAAINTIGDLFGGLPDNISGALSSLTSGIISAISGNPVQAAIGALAAVGKIIAGLGNEAHEASIKFHKAALASVKAANSYAKMSGEIDYNLLSWNDLNDELNKAYNKLAEDISKATGVPFSGAQAKKLLSISKKSEQDAYLNELGIQSRTQALRTTSSMTIQKVIGNIEEAISKYSFTPKAYDANTFSGAKTILDKKYESGEISNFDYEKALRGFAYKYRYDLTPMEYQQYSPRHYSDSYLSKFGEGGIVTQPTAAIVGEQPEVILPLTKLDRIEALLNRLGINGSENKLKIEVAVSGETGSAQRLGEVIGNGIISHFRSKGF